MKLGEPQEKMEKIKSKSEAKEEKAEEIPVESLEKLAVYILQ